MRRLLPAALVAALLPLPQAAHAHVFEQLGYEPRGVAMGGAQTAAGDGHVASFFNPSMLALSREASVGLGIVWLKPVMDVHAQALSDASRLKLLEDPDTSGITLGFLFPMGGKVGNRLALGVGLFAPVNNLIRTEAITPGIPSWYFYHSKPSRIIVAASLGIRILDWLYVGAGAQMLGAFVGGFQMRVNLFNQEFEQRGLKNDLETAVAPLAGLTLDFQQIGLRAAFSYRAPLFLRYDMPTTFDIADVGVINLRMQGTVHYTPHTMSLGLRYQYGSLVASAELRYALWSNAPDPSVQISMGVDSEVLAALGANERFDATSTEVPPEFSDTLEPHLGVEWQIVPMFAARMGYAFKPTPVPLQNGDTNILDGDTHAFAAGLGFSFSDPLEVFSKPVHIDLAYQFLYVPERRANKSSNSDVPSYVYSGYAHNVTAAVRYVF